MEFLAIESQCLEQVLRLTGENNLAGEQGKKMFKLVNAMLQVLDHDGLYGAVVYAHVYGKEQAYHLLTSFNLLLNQLPDNSYEVPVNKENISAVRNMYGQELSGEDSRSRAALMLLRRLLIHLRYAAKAADS